MALSLLLILLPFHAAPAPPAQPLTDHIVIIVHPETGISQLQTEDLVRLYLMEQTHWADGTAVQLFDLRGSTAAKKVFYDALGRQPRDLKRSWMRLILAGEATSPTTVRDVAAMVDGVAETPGAIGYVPADAVDDRVTVVARLPR